MLSCICIDRLEVGLKSYALLNEKVKQMHEGDRDTLFHSSHIS